MGTSRRRSRRRSRSRHRRQVFFKSLLLFQFSSDLHENGYTWSMWQYAKIVGSGILKFWFVYFWQIFEIWNLDLVSDEIQSQILARVLIVDASYLVCWSFLTGYWTYIPVFAKFQNLNFWQILKFKILDFFGLFFKSLLLLQFLWDHHETWYR